uniref:ShKT domain-containing protein n=1 Tax=Chaetoceros debilis TaxID=122233 RepID=A0A7S3Q6U8_9STRA
MALFKLLKLSIFVTTLIWCNLSPAVCVDPSKDASGTEKKMLASARSLGSSAKGSLVRKRSHVPANIDEKVEFALEAGPISQSVAMSDAEKEEQELLRFLEEEILNASLSLSLSVGIPSISPAPSLEPSTSYAPSTSKQPSTIPSGIPSALPSNVTSDSPSAIPSTSPSNNPTGLSQSDSPSRVPSDSPSRAPSSSPTAKGLISPSTMPSTSPAPTPHGQTAAPVKSPVVPPTVPMTSSPTVSICKDDPVFYYNRSGRTCSFIDLDSEKRNRFCAVPLIQAACPRTCGRCCFNDQQFRFNVRNIPRKCNWMQRGSPSRPKRFCSTDIGGGLKIQDFCPKACNICRQPPPPAPSPLSQAPTPSSSPTGLCKNDDTWNWYDFPEGNCKWVRNKEKRREKFCGKSIVRENCPQSCGLCCQDDLNYSFVTAGSTQGCFWVGQLTSRQDAFCNSFQSGDMVRNACPEACQRCLTLIGGT